MKTITVSDEVLDGLDTIGVHYIEGDTVYKVDWFHVGPLLVGWLAGVFTIIGLLMYYYPPM